eukprot:SAG31_NODE_20161_length_582_cov_0.732919_1_plen_23_part_10
MCAARRARENLNLVFFKTIFYRK